MRRRTLLCRLGLHDPVAMWVGEGAPSQRQSGYVCLRCKRAGWRPSQGSALQWDRRDAARVRPLCACGCSRFSCDDCGQAFAR